MKKKEKNQDIKDLRLSYDNSTKGCFNVINMGEYCQ